MTSIVDTTRTTTSNSAPSADPERKRRQIGLNLCVHLLTHSAATKRNSEQAFSVGPTRCANDASQSKVRERCLPERVLDRATSDAASFPVLYGSTQTATGIWTRNDGFHYIETEGPALSYSRHLPELKVELEEPAPRITNAHVRQSEMPCASVKKTGPGNFPSPVRVL